MEMMMRTWMIAGMVLIGLLVSPLRAEDTEPEAQPEAEAEAPSRFAEMDEELIKEEMKRLMSEITDMSRRSRVIRARAMAQDEDLRALNQQIANLEKQIQKTIAEKYPTLAGLETKTAEAIAEHGEAAAELRERKAPKPEAAGE